MLNEDSLEYDSLTSDSDVTSIEESSYLQDDVYWIRNGKEARDKYKVIENQLVFSGAYGSSFLTLISVPRGTMYSWSIVRLLCTCRRVSTR